MFQSGSAALRTVITGLCFIIAGLGAALYPVMPTLLAVALIVYGVVLWRWPSAWLVVLPALFPVLDLTPWTGWLLVGEYHLFGLMTVGVLILRAPPSADDIRPSGLGGVATMLALLACLVSVAIGLTSPLPLPSTSDLIYLEPMNALRLAGGFGLALLLFPFMRERQRSGCPVVQLLGTGVVVGLVLVAIAVIVERALFPGLFDFQEDYRVAASFSSMHLGGGHIGAYLAFASPFLFVCLLRLRPTTFVAMLIVALLSAYALVVTFARAAYFAAFISLSLAVAGWLIASMRRGREKMVGSVMPAVMISIVLSALGVAALDTDYMSARFASLSPDLTAREDNWAGGMALRDKGIVADIFGMGLGTYPRAVASRRKGNAVPGNFVIARESGERALLMTVGAPYYFGQKVPAIAGGVYRLSVDVQSSDPHITIEALLCEKWLLYSEACDDVQFKPQRQGQWEHFSATLSTAKFSRNTLLGLLRSAGGVVPVWHGAVFDHCSAERELDRSNRH